VTEWTQLVNESFWYHTVAVSGRNEVPVFMVNDRLIYFTNKRNRLEVTHTRFRDTFANARYNAIDLLGTDAAANYIRAKCIRENFSCVRHFYLFFL